MKFCSILRASACAITFASSVAAFGADDTSDQTIIVTGTKTEFGEKSGIPIEKMAQSVQVISSEDIVKQGASSIGDLLRAVPSANAGYSRVGAYQSFSLKLRGFLADQMRNGIRQRYYEDVDASALSNIERVEVLKGPSGVLYGQSAVGGIVSIITKRPQEDPAYNAAVTLGTFDQKMLSLDATGAIADGLTVRMTGEVERSGTFVDFQDIRRLNGAISLRYVASESVTANLVAEYVERKTRRNPGLPILGTVQSNGVGPIDRGLYLGEPTIDDLLSHAPLVQAWVDVKISDNWTITPRFQFSEFNTRFYQIRLRSPQANQTTINRNGRQGRENDEYYIAQLDVAGELNTGNIGHKLLFGLEYDRERGRFSQSNLTNVSSIDVVAPEYLYNVAAPTSAFAFDNFYNIDGNAVYLQDQIDLNDRWNIIGALRHSWIDASDGTFRGATANQAKTSTTIWQIGSTYRLNDAISLYAGYNTGFDVESSAAARSANGAPLLPEKSSQAEIGVRFSSGPLRGSISAFEIKRTNALTTDPANPDFSINVGQQRVRGFEVEASVEPVKGWSLRAGYANLNSEITQSNDGDQGLRLGDVPKHGFTANTEFEVPGTSLKLRGGLNHVSNRLLTNGSSVVLPSYTLANLGAGIRVAPFTLDLAVNNILDERYFTASGNAFAVYPGDPRTISLRVGVGF